jgi:Single-strand binding protein family
MYATGTTRKGTTTMAKSVNRTFLLGHVGKNPEVGTTPGGTLAVNFSLATTDREKDRQGNWSDRTEWHNLVAYGRTAESLRNRNLFLQYLLIERHYQHVVDVEELACVLKDANEVREIRLLMALEEILAQPKGAEDEVHMLLVGVVERVKRVVSCRL